VPVDPARVLAVVPARGGSKGVPRKNLAEVGGRTLVALAVGCALRAGFGRVIASTDDPEIAAEAAAAGAEVPALRPAELAGDAARTADAVLHVLSVVGTAFDAVMVVQPTTPLRTAADLRAACALLDADPQADAVAGASRLDDPHPAKTFRVEDGRMLPFLPEFGGERPRQSLPPAYRLNGAVYLTRTPVVLGRRTLMTDRTRVHVMPPERSLNIDHPWDLVLLRALLAAGEVALEDDGRTRSRQTP